MRTALGCLVAILLLAGLIALGYWVMEPELRRWMDRSPASAPEATVRTAEDLQSVMQAGDSTRLSEAEANALLEGPLGDWIPPEWSNPALEMSGDTLRLFGTIRTELLPAPGELATIRAMLPDTARLRLSGTVEPLEPGAVRYSVHGIRVSRIPVPERFHPDMLRGTHPPDPRLGPTDLVARLPHPARSARVRDGHLLLYP